MSGKVYLVGAGPGDPGLITVAGVEALKQADVVLYDRLVSPEIMEYVPAGAEKIYAGKNKGDSSPVRQNRVNEQLIEFALAGKTVVRLKGGDPFVFGRGGEEALALKEKGITWEVIPGVSSLIAAPASAGIPVTHRGLAHSFAVFAAREAGGADSGIDWASAAAIPVSIFLMGVERLPLIVERLQEHGKSADTPIALIQQATTPHQKTVTGTLADIVEKAKDVKSPATIIVGEVVSLREQIL